MSARLLSFILAIASIVTFVSAPHAGQPAATAAPAAAMTIDGTHSSVVFKVLHLQTANFYGRFNKIGGDVALDDKGGTVNVEVDADSVDTNNAKRDGHLKGQDFFSVKEFPKITFKSKSATKKGDGWEVAGDLSLHGVTKPLTVTVKPTGSGADPMGKKLGYETTFTFKRSDYGMTYGIDQQGARRRGHGRLVGGGDRQVEAKPSRHPGPSARAARLLLAAVARPRDGRPDHRRRRARARVGGAALLSRGPRSGLDAPQRGARVSCQSAAGKHGNHGGRLPRERGARRKEEEKEGSEDRRTDPSSDASSRKSVSPPCSSSPSTSLPVNRVRLHEVDVRSVQGFRASLITESAGRRTRSHLVPHRDQRTG